MIFETCSFLYPCLRNHEASSQGTGILCHCSTKIVNKKQWRVDEFVNSPLPGKILSDWLNKHLPQISCASFSSALKFLPGFVSFPNFQTIFYHWTSILFPQLSPVHSLEDVRDKGLLQYEGRQRKGQQELNKREEIGRGSRRGKTHLFPSLSFKRVLESEQWRDFADVVRNIWSYS